MWVVQGYYNGVYGWEDLCYEDEKSEIMDRLTEYRMNEGMYNPTWSYRIRRVKDE